MNDKRFRLLLWDDQKRVSSALWEIENLADALREPPPERGALPCAIGETICSVEAYGYYFDRYATSYEFEIDGPVLITTESGHLYRLFGDSIRSCPSRDLTCPVPDDNSIPPRMRQALDRLRGHRILDICREDGLLTITLDGKITIESWNGCMNEFSEISLFQRL